MFENIFDVKYLSMSLSHTLNRIEKVEQHIRKNIHKLNALRFLVKNSIIFLYKLAQFPF